ncbi:zinc ribbon domain protein [Bacillus phage 015DV002]|nr:zinc ribbon domain protein [Bacillus phage 015DV002]QQO41346.1 zinc ribbon domain protein [Bacillus phage 015DV004]
MAGLRSTKYVRMFCPDCGDVLTNAITCVGTGSSDSSNEFYVEDLTDMEFYCSDCGTRYYVQKPHVVSDEDFI